MTTPALLLRRLDLIADSLRTSGTARALLALGSIGTELDRLDAYSDLDFFVIAKKGMKEKLIADLFWLSNAAPLAYHFKNTKDGYKVLFTDGIYAEFAVFEESEMKEAVFAAGRIVWQEDDFDASLCIPKRISTPSDSNDIEFLIGEALTNLHVGLCRYARGEKLSGMRFIQSYAVDRLIACSARFEKEQPAYKDQFQQERRYEQRFPALADRLPSLLQGYERTPESALALLRVIEEFVPVNPFIKKEIVALAQELIERKKKDPSVA